MTRIAQAPGLRRGGLSEKASTRGTTAGGFLGIVGSLGWCRANGYIDAKLILLDFKEVQVQPSIVKAQSRTAQDKTRKPPMR